ncbi:CheR family methyltransferase [Neorhodopirellula pilleata]|uniref:protein-glutamate O-methyltransferase n=1 Tax=Neorhodopirellula pilleata TaxID=2714738 RepID=A0A5C6ADA9_9BACT|nr:protein-glutamate O-methyltransferase CheR [Neorhodopirellula pilleata]TWT96233.1 Chemotaxis protein methyltransferase Cher2 [Neorhodopirellula pilleata]
MTTATTLSTPTFAIPTQTAAPAAPAGLVFQPEACERLCRLLKDWCGVKIESSKSYLIQGRLRALMTTEGIADLTALLDRAERPGGTRLRDQIVDMMTTHETLFFRDTHPFEVMITKILPPMLADPTRTAPIQIHCAACSSGQEPYSIAMMLQERLSASSYSRIRIAATDISTGTIAQARKGEFMDHELRRGLTTAQRERFFEPINGTAGSNDSRLINSIRSMVRFDVMNLTSPNSVATVAGQVDILLCRNVLIYFDTETCQRVMRALASVIRPGGLLLLGASEMLRDSEGMFQTEVIGTTRFQRRVPASTTASTLGR